MRHLCGLLILCGALGACDERRPLAQASPPDDASSSASLAPDVAIIATPPPDRSPPPTPPDALAGLVYPEPHEPLSCDSWLARHASLLVRLPPEYDALVPRVSYPAMHRVEGLIHEGHNVVMRGEGSSRATFEDSGAQIAHRWRTLACGMGGLFVLRDSLFSQQDHALAHDPFALMLPPNWVTRAAWLTHRGEPIVNVARFDAQDDEAWAAASDDAIFGSFPVSPSLLQSVRHAVRGEGVEAMRARHGRRALAQLYGHVQAMQRAAPFGWREVSRAGAARIAWSDRAYFGQEARREVIIPILVEHPNAHELEEGKGVLWEGGAQQVPGEVVDAVTEDVYRERLRDGALAIERYDISNLEDRQRAISLLEVLIPPGPDEPITTLWLWINGPLDPARKLQGESPLAFMEAFERELERASIDRSRLRLLGKPTTRIGRKLSLARKRGALRDALTRYEAAGLDALSIDQSATSLRDVSVATER